MRWLQKIFRFRESSGEDVVQPFLDHLEELRWTLIRMALVQVATTSIALGFRRELVQVLQAPLAAIDPVPRLMTTGVGDSLMISLELAFFAGLAVALPYHLLAVARFILPALTRKERGFLVPGIAAGFLLFLAGAGLAYGCILPATVEFLWKDADAMALGPQWTWRAYCSFASWLCFGFGAMCEIPMVIVVLALLGLVNHGMLRKMRSYAYTGILVLAAIIAPTPDPVMLLTLAIPIILLYEACIWVVRFVERRGWNAELITAAFTLWWVNSRGDFRDRTA